MAAVVALGSGAAVVHVVDRPHVEATAPAPHEPHFGRVLAARHFVQGNLHTHTTASDGDSSPVEVARWYRDHGYGFVALTDHEVLTLPSDLSSLVSVDFAILAGEEITMRVDGRGVHVNALCTGTVIPGGTFARTGDALAHAIGAIRAQGGVALVNHPNFDWALTEADVVAAAKDGAALLEIASGHPYVRSRGDDAHPSHERLWDAVLTSGYDVMGVGVDDMHSLVTDRDPEAFPGQAWVQVFADDVSPEAICSALRHGELYASTGPTLRSIDVSGLTYAVDPLDHDAVISFLGKNGRVLATAERSAGIARYVAQGDEGFVRARVDTSRGTAWTPAVRIER